ncbi:MAG: hypothetical protein WCA20_10745 [Candidatus Sulfotelmatobacter sp.]
MFFVGRLTPEEQSAVSVRIIAPEEAQLWSEISARGWSHEHPELRDFLLNLGTLSAAREESLCFLAEHDGKPGAAGVLCIQDGVALFGGSALSALGVWSATRKSSGVGYAIGSD